jgi:hypothetical protein
MWQMHSVARTCQHGLLLGAVLGGKAWGHDGETPPSVSEFDFQSVDSISEMNEENHVKISFPSHRASLVACRFSLHLGKLAL